MGKCSLLCTQEQRVCSEYDLVFFLTCYSPAPQPQDLVYISHQGYLGLRLAPALILNQSVTFLSTVSFAGAMLTPFSG